MRPIHRLWTLLQWALGTQLVLLHCYSCPLMLQCPATVCSTIWCVRVCVCVHGHLDVDCRQFLMLSVFFMFRTPWLCYYLFIHLWIFCLLFPFSGVRCFYSFIRISHRILQWASSVTTIFFLSLSVAVHNLTSICGKETAQPKNQKEKNRNVILLIDFCSALHLLLLSHLARLGSVRLQYMNSYVHSHSHSNG